MRTIVHIATAFAVLAASAPAVAQNAPSQATPATDARADRGVLICARDDDSRRAFRREYGEAPIFLTADQALRAAKTEVWSAPRCMTAQEHARYQRLRAAQA